MSRALVAAAAIAAGACASTPSTTPPAQSAEQHRLDAAAHEHEAQLHSAQYTRDGKTRCEWRQGSTFSSCWTEENPTEAQRAIAESHRRAAAEHRVASQALRDAEDLSCAGLAQADIDESPFAHRADIVRVEALHTEKEKVARLEGALVEFRPVSGLTPSILQHIVDCHLARDAALGNDVPEMSYCPLVPKGITAKVRWTDPKSTGLVVEIRAKDDATAHEVWRRASELR